MKIAVVGGVVSSMVLVQALIRHGICQIMVWGYEPSETNLVSGWRDLRKLAGKHRLPFEGFQKIENCEESLRNFEPDVLFVVGLSQIIPPSMLDIACKANIGFHPTCLPRGRGRAALAWLILKSQDGAATFFEICEGVDDGPIYEQEHFSVSDTDDTSDVEAKLLAAERVALDRLLPRLKSGDYSTIVQDHEQADWLGRRAPEDGWVNWRRPSDELLRLIRASAPPHPGAYTFCLSHRLVLLKAELSDRRETGVVGRIMTIAPNSGFEVQTGDGVVRVIEWHCDTGWKPRVGQLLGYYAEAEIFELRARIEQLEHLVGRLKTTLD